MTRLDDLLETYAADLTACGETVDLNLLRAVVKICGPVVYRKDASLVSASDKTELARIRADFLIEQLGMKDGEKLDAGLKAVTKRYSKRDRHLAVFYYLLVKHFKKRSALLTRSPS